MKSLKVITSLVATGVVGQTQCERQVELAIVQDSSGSFVTFTGDMSARAKLLIDRLKEKMDHVKVSVADFSDKPVPFRGMGGYGGHPEAADHCYNNGYTSALSDDASVIAASFEAASQATSLGGDYPENPYEAMMYAALDPKINWSDPDVVFDEDHRHIVRVMLTVTDDLPHYYGDAQNGINDWNPSTTDPDWHFWGVNFGNAGALYSEDSKVQYTRLYNLHQKLGELTEAEKAEFDELLAILGPAEWDAAKDHPGTFEAVDDCHKYEYPKLAQVGDVLKSRNIVPVFALSTQSTTDKYLCEGRGIPNVDTVEEWGQCLSAIYEQDMKDAGVQTFLTTTFGTDADDFIDKIVALVDEISRDSACPEPTTTTSSTEAPVTTPSTSSEAPSTSSSGPSTTSTEASPHTSTESPATTDDEDETTGTTTEGGASDGGSKSKTGVIAGAAGGAGALIAGAGLLYKRFGLNPFKSSSAPDLTPIEQVDTPENPVDREVLEEVTMDMFQ